MRSVLAESQETTAHFELGLVLQMQHRFDAAEASYRTTIAAEPSNAEAHNCLGVVLHSLGRDAESLAAHQRALSLRPGFVDAHNNAAVVLQALGRAEEAFAHYERALVLSPEHAGLYFNSAATLESLGRLDEAEERYRKALELAPDLAIAHNSLGGLLRRQGRLEMAVEHFASATRLQPGGFAQARLGLAYALMELSRFEPALEQLDGYLAAHPLDHGALMQRGRALEQLGRLPQAQECYSRAIELAPGSAEAYTRLGGLQRHRGDHDEAIATLRHAIGLAPDFAPAWSGLLFALNLAEGLSPADIFAPHREFGRRFTPEGVHAGHPNPRDPERRLRLGYVSGDFRAHPVAQFVEPVLEHHDRKAVEVFCYYTIGHADAVTDRIKRHADGWRDVSLLSDGALADRIRADGIDVLVDLSGHTAHNRLLAFARKPAPVQATWLGYLNTTGLPAMDWRIVDPHAAPGGLLEAYHTERLMRLPNCQWCYRAPPGAPEVRERLPAPDSSVVFAAFTNPAKITRGAVAAWSRLLVRLPRARLLVVGQGLDSIAGEFRGRFTRHGVGPGQIAVRGFASFSEYLDLHGEVDVMLDTFPYAGGTTSCHSLWMGVPLVTLAGDTATSRGGASLLETVGLPELVSDSVERYVEIAENLVNEPRRLKGLRDGLRRRMAASPLMDAVRFTSDLESAYRTMWKAWCERPA